MRDLKLIPIFVEQGGTPVEDVAWKVLDVQIKDSNCTPCFVFGNEQKGIGDNVSLET